MFSSGCEVRLGRLLLFCVAGVPVTTRHDRENGLPPLLHTMTRVLILSRHDVEDVVIVVVAVDAVRVRETARVVVYGTHTCRNAVFPLPDFVFTFLGHQSSDSVSQGLRVLLEVSRVDVHGLLEVIGELDTLSHKLLHFSEERFLAGGAIAVLSRRAETIFKLGIAIITGHRVLAGVVVVLAVFDVFVGGAAYLVASVGVHLFLNGGNGALGGIFPEPILRTLGGGSRGGGGHEGYDHKKKGDLHHGFQRVGEGFLHDSLGVLPFLFFLFPFSFLLCCSFYWVQTVSRVWCSRCQEWRRSAVAFVCSSLVGLLLLADGVCPQLAYRVCGLAVYVCCVGWLAIHCVS